ncbi:hypothetical protein [Halorarum salinum]|uniref:Ig-like domain-containing protein n=1 Tax=Halorarum salinum TaxID=2743089 RepID=A0A7D5QMP1_9EURY|nr:hypothetical protein [Halobaculum salinum]QLG63625.1 hypothetical protein HUG12_18580 [Halobaculum salinum]
MRRRTFQAAVGAGLLSLPGCLSAAGGDGRPDGDGTDTPDGDGTPDDDGTGTPGEPGDRRYEECPREVIPYDQFPEEVRAEIDAALDGRYESDRVFLREAMDVDGSYVSVEETYYDPTLAVEGDREVLELRPVEPKALPNPRPVSVEQTRDGKRTVTVELVADDGTVLIDESRDLWPGGEVEFGRTHRVGTHELRITVTDGGRVEDEVTDPVRIGESHFDVLAVVEPDDVSLTGTVADLGYCRFDAENDG